jgi:leucyl aminopeptidase (aminopeptidase T)
LNQIVGAVKSADLIIRTLLGVKPHEQILIISDEETDMDMVYSLAAVANTLGAEYTIAIMRGRGVEDAHMLTKPIAKALEGSDVVIGITKTSYAPSYAPEVLKLLKERKIRYMSMIMRTMENWIKGAATADYVEMHKLSQKLVKILEGGRNVRITTESGTNITGIIEGRKAVVEDGWATEPGQAAAFSDGEVAISPIEGSAEGILIVDGPISYMGKGWPDEPVKLVVKKGRVVNAEGGRWADRLREWIFGVENADNVAEFSIGINPRSRRTGDISEEKKGLGNVHIGIGENRYYGGIVGSPLHIDMVIYNSTYELDGLTIVERGRLLI